MLGANLFDTFTCRFISLAMLNVQHSDPSHMLRWQKWGLGSHPDWEAETDLGQSEAGHQVRPRRHSRQALGRQVLMFETCVGCWTGGTFTVQEVVMFGLAGCWCELVYTCQCGFWDTCPSERPT